MHRLTLPAGAYRNVVFADAARVPDRPARPAATVEPSSAPFSTAAEADRPALSGDDEALVRWIFRQSGLDLRHYRPETLKRRVPACLRALRVDSPQRAHALLRRDPDLLPAALGALVIGVTGVFRDAPAFAALRDRVLPALAAGGRRLRVWSVGCSNGAELYSVAILRAEQRVLSRCGLLGTDGRPDAVARAATGLFRADAVAGVPQELLTRHF